MLKNKSTILTLIYIFPVILGFLYVRSTLTSNKQAIGQKSKDEQITEEIKPIKVTFVFNAFSEKVKMQNVNNIDDLLDKMYSEKKLTYEKTAYIYGTEISEVNKVKSTSNEKWIVITDNSSEELDLGERLTDGTTYRLVLIKK